MINRIKENEEKLDNINNFLEELTNILEKYPKIKKELKDLNKYYGSKKWFNDLNNYEKGSIPKIKAGVLSEDGIWNTNEKWNEVISDLSKLIEKENNNEL